MANENARAASGAVARHPQSASLATTSTTLPATSPASASTATESAITAAADRASTPKTHAARAPSKIPTSAPASAPRSAPAPTGRERRARMRQERNTPFSFLLTARIWIVLLAATPEVASRPRPSSGSASFARAACLSHLRGGPAGGFHPPALSPRARGVAEGQGELEAPSDAGVVTPPDDDPTVVQASGLLKVPRERRIDEVGEAPQPEVRAVDEGLVEAIATRGPSDDVALGVQRPAVRVGRVGRQAETVHRARREIENERARVSLERAVPRDGRRADVARRLEDPAGAARARARVQVAHPIRHVPRERVADVVLCRVGELSVPD